MFSAALERILNVAAREAMVRRHANLTVEHLLFAVAHDPDGEEILEGAGADVARLRRELEEFLDYPLRTCEQYDSAQYERNSVHREPAIPGIRGCHDA